MTANYGVIMKGWAWEDSWTVGDSQSLVLRMLLVGVG